MVVRLFFAGLIVLLVVLGCGGGGGGGGGSGSGLLPGGSSVAVSGTISGTIEIDQAISALRPDISSFSPSLRFLDSFVMIEELPNVSTRADQDGKFIFENVPFGTYRIIARVTSLAGRVYKLRTTAQSLTQADAQKTVAITVAQPDLAENQIRMLIKDLNGNPVGKCKIWFWGEQFTLEASGYYVSPYMPAGASGLIRVEPPADKNLSGLEFNIPATTFNPANIEIVGITLPTAGITNKAPIVSISTGKYPEGGSAFLRLFGHYSDPEGEPMTTSWLTNVSTFTYVARDYADWAVPSISASVTVYFSVSEDGKYYPRLTSLANLNINVASSGEVSFPGEILLRPVTRSVDIIGSSTSQIAGNTLTSYEAKTNFPPGLQLYYNWTVSRGTLLSSATASIISWRSPTLSAGDIQIASISVAVTDGIGTATKDIQVRITSVPTVTINQPAATAFEPGLIVFTGVARDYLNTAISPDSMSWYVATDTQPFVRGQTGGATFSWQFVSQGSYTVALEALDANGVTGTGTKKITIINARPVCAITQPLNDASFMPDTPVTFAGTANDHEDGAITDATRLVWTSDIDGVIGSGTTFTVATLTSSRHEIRLSATDSGGAIGSKSIVIWYDVPARISFTPADRSVFFIGYNIPFAAVGTDTDNIPLDSSLFKWYQNDQPAPWREGASFVITSGAYVPGVNRVRVEGPAKFETAVSPTHAIQMGWPVASITSPASGTRFEPGATVDFTAVPDSTGTLSLQWYLNNETLYFGSGSTVGYVPPNGAHSVTYIGSDSQGIVSSSTINIVVERVPIVSFFPLSGSYLFTGRAVQFNATCLDSDNNDIADDRVSWLFNGSPWLTVSGKTFSRTQPAQIASGTHAITLIASGPYGTVGSHTNTITAGIPAAKIVNPASNATFLPGTLITFEGTPGSIGTIDMGWWATYGTSAPIKIGDGATVATNTLPDGYPIITYMGTDSSGFVSSASRKIGIGLFPVMDFTPDQGKVFFANRNVVFAGVGSDTLDGALSPARMSWYIDGALELASYSVLTITPARIAVLGAGLKDIELRGINSLGAEGTIVKKIYLGVPIAAIASPAVSDAIIPTDTPCDFTAVPDSVSGAEITEPLTMQWWLNYSLPGALQIGTGESLTYTLPPGLQYLTYIGTDSQNIVSSATTRIRVSNSPSITFTPPNDSRLFVGRPFELRANDAVVIATSVVWSLDGGLTAWKSGSPVTVLPGELPVGTNIITAAGQNDLGVVASIPNSIYYGVELASITSPASGAEYLIVDPLNTPVSFAAVPVPSAQTPMQWYRDDGGGAVYMGNAATLTGYAMPQGRHTITYVGSDSYGSISSSSIQILINSPPPMQILPGANPVFFAGRSVSFVGSGTSVISGQAVASASMKWYLNGSHVKSDSPAVFSEAEQPGTPATLYITGVDDYGMVGTLTPAINVTFKHPAATITQPASGDRFDVGQAVNLKGTPSSLAPISMMWYLDNGSTPFASVPDVSISTFTPGLHTITYVGTDSANFCSSATIQILINNAPSVALWTPALPPSPDNNLVFFSGRPIALTATGTTSTGGPVATFSWYINGSTVASHTGASIVIATASLPASDVPYSVKIEGVDQFGIKEDFTFNLYRRPQPAISSPTPGQRFASGSAVLFEGSPDSLPNLTMQWWYDYASGGALLGAGAPFTSAVNAIPFGSRTIKYIATDSSGFVGSASIQIVMSASPTMKITPAGGAFFERSVVLSGSGTSAIGEPIASSSFRWYVDGALRVGLNGQVSPTFNVVDIAEGNRTITLRGEDVYGTQAEIDASFYFRYANPSIASPTNGATVDHSLPVTLKGQPDSYLPDIQLQWYDDGTPLNRFGANPSTVTLGRGLHTIEYSATDSGNVWATAAVQVLANRPPTVDFLPAGVPRYFVGRPVTLEGFGSNSDSPVAPVATFSWKVNSFNYPVAGTSTIIINTGNLNVGFNNITVYGTDELVTIGTSSARTIYYGESLASVTAPFNNYVYPSSGNTINCGAIPAPASPEITTQWYLNDVLIATGTNAGSITFTDLPIASYTVRYVASDSSGYISSSSVKFTVNDVPSLEILALKNDAAPSPFYFLGRPAMFIGSGTSRAGVTIDPVNNMKWSVNGGSVVYTGSPATLTANLTPGLNTVMVTATDTLNELATATISVRFAVPHVTISYPPSGITLSTLSATNASFAGSLPPDPPHAFIPDWHHETGTGSPRSWNGSSLSGISFASGLHTIRYLATDSSGFVSSATVSILVNNEPTLEIIPGPNSIFFAGRNIYLEASGTSNPGGVSVSTFSWYVNDTPKGTGSSKTLDTSWLVNGNNTVKIAGTDNFGTIGTFSQTIYYGYPLPNISAPPSGTVLLFGNNIDLEGTPAALLGATPKWWIGGVEQPGVSTTLNWTPTATGVYSIQYVATDSSFADTGYVGSSTRNIRVSNRPQMTFTPASNSYFFAGYPVTFSGIGTSSEGLPISGASMSWYLNDSPIAFVGSSTYLVSNLQFITGDNKLRLTGTDMYGTVGEVTGLNLRYVVPSVSITDPGMNSVFPTTPPPDIYFEGSPDLSAYGLNSEWYHINGAGSPAGPFVGTSTTITSFAPGPHTIRFVAYDSAGRSSSATVNIMVNDAPIIHSFSPASNTAFFAGGSVVLTANASEALAPNDPITGDNIKWYRGGIQIATDTPVTIPSGSWTVGTHSIYVTAKDPLGSVATAPAQSFYYGHPQLTIASPSTNIWVNSGAPVTLDFVGSNASGTINLQWYLNGSPVGITNPISIPITSDGQHKIEYTGRDSSGNVSTATVMVIVRNEPTMSILLPSSGLPASGSHFFTVADNQAKFTGSGVNTASMTWQLDALAPQIATNPITFLGLTNGWHTVKLTGTYEPGVTSYTTAMFYYGHPLLTISSPPASGTRISSTDPIIDLTGTVSSAAISLSWKVGSNVQAGVNTNVLPNVYPRLADGWNTITYIGTDSANILSSHSIMLLKNDIPSMKAIPGNGSRFFANTAVTFTNDNSLGGDGFTPVLSGNMNWYLDGAVSPTLSATDTASFSVGQLTTLDHILRFSGTDQHGTTGTATINFYYGHPVASISSPASGSRIDINSSLSFAGNSNSVGSITMEWYRHPEVATYMGSGINIGPVTFTNRGYKTITYIGTDSANFVSSSTIQILVNTPPTMAIASPTASGSYFGGQSLYFAGSGTDSSPLLLADPASVSWYIDNNFKATGFSYTAPIDQLPTGTRTIRFEGKDNFGTISSVTRTIEAGFNSPRITIPASGTIFWQAQLATFTGEPNLVGKINTMWQWVNGPGSPVIGSGSTSAIATMTRGWQTISYIGSDSAGTERSDSIMVLVASPPHFITTATITSPVVFAYGPEYGLPGNRIPIHLVSQSNYGLDFIAQARDGNLALIPSASMTWYLGGSAIGNGNTMYQNFPTPGSYTIQVAAKDEYGLVATSSLTFWVWEKENYSAFTNMPASIIARSDTELIVAEVNLNSVRKLTRSTSTIETSRGDITAVATWTDNTPLAGYVLTDFSLAGNRIYTLASSAFDHRFSEWSLTDFTFTQHIIDVPQGPGPNDLNNPRGLSVQDGAAIYVSDTGQGLIKKMDLSGVFYLNSQAVTAPVGIRYIDASNVYVAAKGTNQLKKFTSALNAAANWNSSTNATNATQFVVGQSNNHYVTDPDNARINVINTSGDLLYSFGSSADFTEPYGITITGAPEAYDMYITDKSGNKIVRFRSNNW
ncbi:MAG: hypothetical protein CVV41_05355 [Candidatus Riflebacteria bacterium HGW-Riflebacteria-1]|nr:MAG: hypothetical protein CVV41_05355 [Candidatus Riflebacteria bacterium HGW-Riflebacteria-1]